MMLVIDEDLATGLFTKLQVVSQVSSAVFVLDLNKEGFTWKGVCQNFHADTSANCSKP